MSRSPPADGEIAAAWRDHRPYLVNLAYQMLGDVGEAEDIAQEAFLRLSRADLAEIDDVRGWLTVVAGRLCLDQLRSARVRLETKCSGRNHDWSRSTPTAIPPTASPSTTRSAPRCWRCCDS